MPVINFVLVHCAACGELRKAIPETVYQPTSLEWSRLKCLKCPKCAAQMRPVPEYGAPTYSGKYFTRPGDVAWMH